MQTTCGTYKKFSIAALLFFFAVVATNTSAQSDLGFTVNCFASASDVIFNEQVTYQLRFEGDQEPTSISWEGNITSTSPRGHQATARFSQRGTFYVVAVVTAPNGTNLRISCPPVRVDEPETIDDETFPAREQQSQSQGSNSIIGSILDLFRQTGASQPQIIKKNYSHEGTPFGGLITGQVICTCSGNYLIIVNDAYSRQQKNILVWPPYSKLYANYVFNPGQYALGTYTSGPKCLIFTGFGCREYPTDGAINRGPGAGSSGPYFYDISPSGGGGGGCAGGRCGL